MMDIRTIVTSIIEVNTEIGWVWDNHAPTCEFLVAAICGLIHTEVTELDNAYYRSLSEPEYDPKKILEEIADVFIRCLDFVGKSPALNLPPNGMHTDAITCFKNKWSSYDLRTAADYYIDRIVNHNDDHYMDTTRQIMYLRYEIDQALEKWREGGKRYWFLWDFVQILNAASRVFASLHLEHDWVPQDLMDEIVRKNEYNRSRPFRHGKSV